MADLSIPLVNRAAEALEALLNYDQAKAEQQIRLLTMSEIVYLSIAAKQLAELAGRYINRRCALCDGAIIWDTNPPTEQQLRWRHVDQATSYSADAHRATPGGDSRFANREPSRRLLDTPRKDAHEHR